MIVTVKGTLVGLREDKIPASDGQPEREYRGYSILQSGNGDRTELVEVRQWSEKGKDDKFRLPVPVAEAGKSVSFDVRVRAFAGKRGAGLNLALVGVSAAKS